MIVAFTVVMPILMLALMFFLADIEARHLTQRAQVSERTPSPGPAEGPAATTA